MPVAEWTRKSEISSRKRGKSKGPASHLFLPYKKQMRIASSLTIHLLKTPLSIFIMNLASFLLALLTLHRTGTSIALHEAKSRAHFSTALAILLGESLKMIISFTIAAYSTVNSDKGDRIEEHRYGSLPRSPSSLDLVKEEHQPVIRSSGQKQRWQILMSSILDRKAFILILPAAIYVGQNNLFLYAAGKLEPSMFQAIWQLRLIPTAYLSQIILKKRIGAYRWMSLLGLVVGVVVIQSSFTSTIKIGSFSKELTPVFALLLSAILAALAGVTLESIFTQKETDIWIANIHLSIFSLLPCIFLVAMEAQTSPGGLSRLWTDFNSSYWSWVAVMINGSSGILVALVTKHAGCIANNISGIASIATTHMLELTFSTTAVESTTTMQQLAFFIGMTIIAISSYYYATIVVPIKVPSVESARPLLSVRRSSSYSSGSHSTDQWSDDSLDSMKEKV